MLKNDISTQDLEEFAREGVTCLTRLAILAGIIFFFYLGIAVALMWQW